MPLVVFLLLPGFITWAIFCWGTVSRKISEIQHLAVSLLLSVLSFTFAYFIVFLYKLTTQPNWDTASYPGFMQILVDPKNLTLGIGIATYVVAILFGFILILMYKNEGVARYLNSLGLDLYGPEGVWYRQFHKSDFVTVYLKDGRIIFGWPEYFSQTGEHANSELFLTKLKYYNGKTKKWIDPADTISGLLINTDSISHIEFSTPPLTETQETLPPVLLNKAFFLRFGTLLFSIGLLLLQIREWPNPWAFAGIFLVIISLIFLLIALCKKILDKVNATINKPQNK